MKASLISDLKPMASKLLTLLTISFFVLLPFLTSPSFGDIDPSTAAPPGTICKSTPDPSYCKSVLPRQPNNVYNYGRLTIQKSLSQSQKFLNLLDTFLQRRSTLPTPIIRALEDCHSLASLNVDYLSSSLETVATTSATLSSSKANDIQTLMSSIITNQMTCLDSIQTTDSTGSVTNDLLVPLSDDTKLFSLSLALFTAGWVPKNQKISIWEPTRHQLEFQDGRLPLEMSDETRAIYESVTNNRRILQAPSGVVVNKIVVVSQDGSGNFTTINDAINAAPNNSNGAKGYHLIYIKAGVYEEYVSIATNKKYLMMVGDGINQTVITGNRSVAGGWTTFSCQTFAVTAPYFVAVNITIRNTAGAIGAQAVALRNGADNATFYSCSFEGYQDTLYAHQSRQFYRECDIYGTVDFIFGNAAAVFQNCNLYPRQPLKGQFNAITAQGRTDPNQNTGYSFHNCSIRKADDLAASNYTVKTYLGRPWQNYSRTVYMESFMDSLIEPAGWSIWSGTWALSTLYYAEYNNTGSGSNTTNRVTWSTYHVINATDAANFTVSNFILGNSWLPKTGVPYTGGLLY